MMRGTIKAKLSPALIINSTNLRVMDPIGQGILVAILILLLLKLVAGEFGIVYKGYIVDQYIDEVVAIKTLKGTLVCTYIQNELSLDQK